MREFSKGLCLSGAFVFLGLAAEQVHAEAEWRPVLDVETTLSHDSNVSRGGYKRDRLHDDTAFGRALVSVQPMSTFSSSLRVGVFAEGEKYKEISSLDRSSAGGQATLRWQPVSGFMEPVYQFSVSGQQDDYQVKQRDSVVYTAQGLVSRHVNDRIMAAYGVEGVNRRSDGTVFDTKNIRLFLNLDFELSDVWSAYTNYSYLHGDTFSSAQFTFCNGVVANDIFGLVSASTAIEPDQALNRELCGSWMAYRLKAHTNSLTGGINRGFGHHLSVDFSVQGVQVDTQGNNQYRRVLTRLGLLARF